jgi:hypothetical protein
LGFGLTSDEDVGERRGEEDEAQEDPPPHKNTMFTRGSLLLLALAYLTVGKETTNDGPDFGSTCGVYYAASTIPGAGYGLFAGKDFEINDWIMPGDLVVPIVEINWHNGHESYANLWEDYQWSARRYVCGAVWRVCVSTERTNKSWCEEDPKGWIL